LAVYISRDFKPIRIAMCVYRGNPFSGGQGVYTKHLSEELSKLGHHVEVFSGPPYPVLDLDKVQLSKLASLDLYNADNPFRIPSVQEFGGLIDLAEFAIMAAGGFPEPRSFGWRLEKAIANRRNEFDILHDNQSLSWSIDRLASSGWPVIASIHHPITVDRRLAIENATGLKAKFGAWRWYGFVNMQVQVARRLESIITVSETSRQDLKTEMGIDPQRSKVVPIGVDTSVFRPYPNVVKEEGLIVTTASADVPLKGLHILVEAMAEVCTLEPKAHLVIMGNPNPDSKLPDRISQLGLSKAIRFAGPVSLEEMVKLYNQAQISVVPSLYEGFSLPAIEAMACGVPMVATDGGALPEVTGIDGETVLRARAGDPLDLAKKILKLFDSPILREELSINARERVANLYSWTVTAKATEASYFDLLCEKGLV
jgi:glycosyltransferase involved in cell wall biosynthesis